MQVFANTGSSFFGKKNGHKHMPVLSDIALKRNVTLVFCVSALKDLVGRRRNKALV